MKQPGGHPTGQEAAATVGAPADRRPVLLVEPHEPFREMLKFLLGRWFPDSEVLEAADCAGARELLLKRPPALVVMDHELPGEDGIAFLREIRESQGRPPVLVCTNHDQRDRREAAQAAGALGFYSKWQFETRAARHVLEKVLGRLAADS